MKLKSGFMLREIASQWIVIPLGERTVEFNAILNLSETGADIWKQLELNISDDAIINSIVETYDVDIKIASEDYKVYLDELFEKGLIEYE